MAGGDGDDRLEGADDIVDGGPGADRLFGETADGGPGVDELRLGDDLLRGGDDDDRLLGDDFVAVETVTGGNDSLECGPGTDFADGGPGDDTATQCEVVVNVENVN
jgi:hypothetical protein